MADILKLISHAKFFEGIAPSGQKLLSEICEARHCAKRETLFHEGEEATAIFLLISGDLQLHKTSPDGRLSVIRIIKPGEVFGEVVLFEEQSYPVTAIALTDCFILRIPKAGFLDLLEHKEFRNYFIAMLMRKQRYLAGRVQYLMSHDIEDRLRLFLREHYGESPDITCPLSKKDIAAAIAATPESLSRLLLRLKDAGVLLWEGDKIEASPEFWRG